MFVRDRMSSQLVTVSPETSIMDALELMRRHNIRRLPVMSSDKLIGIVTEQDLLYVSPSPATSLSVYEINYLVSKMQVKEAMTTKPVTVSPDDTVERAALVMRENKVGALPVVDHGKLVGIITETNIFDSFIEMLGLNRMGTRLTVDVENRRGVLEELTNAIRNANADIISLATFELSPGHNRIVIRLEQPNAEKACDAIRARGFNVVHVSHS